MEKGLGEPPAYPGAAQAAQAPYTAPVATAYPAAAPATHVVQATTTTTAIGSDIDRMRLRRTMTNFKATLIMMIVLLVFGVVMLIANAYTDGKGVKTYDNYYRGDYWTSDTKIRRDWHQGIWSGVFHITAAIFFIILYVQARNANFDLNYGSLRGTTYFFVVCVSLLAAIAFVAMVMAGITAGFLQNKNNDSYSSGCTTVYDFNLDPSCACTSKDEFVENASCADAAGVHHGLFSTIAVLNAISVILTIVAAILTCVGTCATCCGSYYYSSPGVVLAAPAQVVQTVPQVGIAYGHAYPAQGQVITTY